MCVCICIYIYIYTYIYIYYCIQLSGSVCFDQPKRGGERLGASEEVRRLE